MSLKSHILLFSLLLLCSFGSKAQVTFSSLAGKVKDETGKPLAGAIVEAIHVPSGSKYGTDTRTDGSFNIENLRIGGPYTVTISFGGVVIKTIENINLELGETYQLEIKQEPVTKELSGVTVTSSRDNTFNNQHTGAATTITEEQIATLPSISRSITDFTSLTPQSSGSNFAGRNSLYNNVQLNGANFNNSMGLSGGNMPGGGQPFSIDAVQQIQVGVSPFDVRQSDFTGANINIVTRSGTNDFTGSVYTYYKDQSFTGKHVDDYDVPPALKNINQVYGARFGGPIIKNKLFFFVSAEYENNVHPGASPNWVATAPGVSGPYVSAVTANQLQQVSDYVKTTYGYNTGAYDNYANNFINKYVRLVSRLDYNINDNNKLDFSFMHYDNSTPSMASSSGVSGGRFGINSLDFANTMYDTKHTVNSLSAELVSKLSSNISNQVLVAYTHVRDTRSSPSSQFPFVDINNGSGVDLMSLGYELFSYKNDVVYNTTAFYDNFTINKGINNITAGVSFQYLTFADSYRPDGTTYYQFNSISDFITNQAPTAFYYTYPYAGQNGYSNVHYGLPGAYLQDRINILPNLTVTAGVRVDMPLYLDKIPANPYIDTLKLLNPAGDTTHYNTNKWPMERPIVQPRVAFNWYPLKDRTLQVRGGTGIFLGQIPFVWMTNVPGNSGTVTNNVQITNSSVLQYLKFNPDPQAALAQLPVNLRNQYFPMQGGQSVPGLIAGVASNFRMPEVWRSDIGADYKLPWLGLVSTLELMYTKDIYSVYQFNANLPKPSGRFQDSSGDNRYYYPYSRINTAITAAMILDNSKNGDAWSSTIGISKPPKKGFYGSLFYTRTYSEEVSDNPGSQALSAWQYVAHVNSPNEATLAPSAYFTPNRIVGTLSYRFEYSKHFATTLSLYYNGDNGGRFSYLIYEDLNIPGANWYDLVMYIPKDAAKMTWGDITNTSTGQVLFTKQQQIDAFNQLINNDKYLSQHKGQYAQRNGGSYPFYNTFNFKVLQDIMAKIGKRKNSLQITADVLNVPNLINRNWGVPEQLIVPGGEILHGFTNTHNGITTYTMQTATNSQGKLFLPTSMFWPAKTPGSAWSMQLGLRYNF